MLHANNQFYELRGYQKEEYRAEFKNRSDATIFPIDLAGVIKQVTEKILNKEKQCRYEYRIRVKDGKTRYILSDTGIHYASDGVILTCIETDITDIKQLEKQLKQQRNILEEANLRLETKFTYESQHKRAMLMDALIYFEFDITDDRMLRGDNKLLKLLGIIWVVSVRCLFNIVCVW